jgi:hypothetical protein
VNSLKTEYGNISDLVRIFVSPDIDSDMDNTAPPRSNSKEAIILQRRELSSDQHLPSPKGNSGVGFINTNCMYK